MDESRMESATPNDGTSNSSELVTKVIKKWLALFATMAGKEVTRPLLDIWLELLGSVRDARTLNAACEQVAKTWRIANTIPPPGEILARMSCDFEKLRKIDALDSWIKARKLIEDYYQADIGYRGPAMSPEMRRAIDSAGGMHMIANCPESELPWCQKRFLEYYERAIAADEISNCYRIEDGDVRRLLSDLGNKKRLQ